MRNIYKIENYQYVHNNLHLSLNENEKEIQIEPAGQVLVDSDHFAFIYVVEEGDGYSYIQLPKDGWQHLVKCIQTEQNPYLTINEMNIELINFTEELHTLIFNIEGNENYGSEFVNAVEEAFAEVLQEDVL